MAVVDEDAARRDMTYELPSRVNPPENKRESRSECQAAIVGQTSGIDGSAHARGWSWRCGSPVARKMNAASTLQRDEPWPAHAPTKRDVAWNVSSTLQLKWERTVELPTKMRLACRLTSCAPRTSPTPPSAHPPGRLSHPLLYLSSYFETHRQDDYQHLQAVRENGDIDGWLLFFLQAVQEQAGDAVARARALIELRAGVRPIVGLGEPRSRSGQLRDSPGRDVKQRRDVAREQALVRQGRYCETHRIGRDVRRRCGLGGCGPGRMGEVDSSDDGNHVDGLVGETNADPGVRVTHQALDLFREDLAAGRDFGSGCGIRQADGRSSLSMAALTQGQARRSCSRRSAGAYTSSTRSR